MGALKWLWVTVLVLVADLVTKDYAQLQLSYGIPYPVAYGLDMTLLYNTGAAFSFLATEAGWQRWFFIMIAIVVSSVLLIWLKRTDTQQRILACGLALILGGALGNLHDRIFLGYVVDFISVYYDRYFFPAFNIADIALTVGTLLMVVDMMFFEKQSTKQA